MDDVVDVVLDSSDRLQRALSEKPRAPFPRKLFEELFNSVLRYAQATKGNPLIHRHVAEAVAGLRCELQQRDAPGDVLFQADRLEVMLFAGYDPQFEGDEPPGV